MNAYSKDLRLRVIDAVDRGLPREEISELFGISHSTIKRWVKRRRQGLDLEPKRSTGRKRRILSTTQGVRVSLATMSRAIRNKLGWSYK